MGSKQLITPSEPRCCTDPVNGEEHKDGLKEADPLEHAAKAFNLLLQGRGQRAWAVVGPLVVPGAKRDAHHDGGRLEAKPLQEQQVVAVARSSTLHLVVDDVGA